MSLRRYAPYPANVCRGLSGLVLFAMVAILAAQTFTAAHAQAAGATLTVLRGNAAVVQASGALLSPAPTGLTLGPGDQIATLSGSSALVTFFEGSELELGADTTIIIRELERQGARTTISIESVLGSTLNRVVTLTDPGSVYRIESGGSVALVRGTTFAHHANASGDVTVAVAEGEVAFPQEGMLIRRGEKRTLTSRGDVVTSSFDPGASLFTTVTEPASSGNPTGTDNPGIGTGSYTAPQQQSLQQANERERDQQQTQTTPGSTVLIVAAPSGTTRLEVASTLGFAVGDLIRIGIPPNSEVGTVVGFGSIILQHPLANSYADGTPINVIGRASPTPTPTGTLTPTPTGTPTLAVVGTFEPTPTATATATPSPSATATATATPSLTAPPSPTTTLTETPSPTPTATATATATSSPSATATATGTATATMTPSPSPTPSPTVTATATPSPSATATVTPSLGTLSGVVRDASTGGVLGGATVRVGASPGTTSAQDGSFILAGVPLGAQTLTTERTGYVADTRSVNVVAGDNAALSIALAPVTALGDISIVLTWGAEPRDLDSHLSGPIASSESGDRFHLYYQNRSAPPVSYAGLDVDDTNGHGPETITIRRNSATGTFVAGEYRYWVHNFSGSPEFDVSSARVAVVRNSTQIADFNVSAASGSPTSGIWFVLTLDVDEAGQVTVTSVQEYRTGSQTTVF